MTANTRERDVLIQTLRATTIVQTVLHAWVCQGGSKSAQQALTWRTLEAHAGAEPPSLEASLVTILAKLPAS